MFAIDRQRAMPHYAPLSLPYCVHLIIKRVYIMAFHFTVGRNGLYYLCSGWRSSVGLESSSTCSGWNHIVQSRWRKDARCIQTWWQSCTGIFGFLVHSFLSLFLLLYAPLPLGRSHCLTCWSLLVSPEGPFSLSALLHPSMFSLFLILSLALLSSPHLLYSLSPISPPPLFPALKSGMKWWLVYLTPVLHMCIWVNTVRGVHVKLIPIMNPLLLMGWMSECDALVTRYPSVGSTPTVLFDVIECNVCMVYPIRCALFITNLIV